MTLLKKKVFFPLENALTLKSYYTQYFKQAHQILVSSDEKKTTIFFLSQDKVRFQEFIVRKRVPLPTFFLLQISLPNFIPHSLYFLYKHVRVLKLTPVK